MTPTLAEVSRGDREDRGLADEGTYLRKTNHSLPATDRILDGAFR